ncbi:MAG: lipoic acid synthetase [Saprospiraceae bacterium]|jgi:lipoic acid synthetase
MKQPSVVQGEKLRGEAKTARIPVKIAPRPRDKVLRKPQWIRASFPGTPEVIALKKILRENKLHTVCEEAACPNLGECFSKGTATFLVMGDICTRRCPFCDVAHGRPNPLDEAEPKHLAETIQKMGLKYVVITSVNRDDLRDGGAEHIMQCVKETHALNPGIKVEILTPDFRGRTREHAIEILAENPPDVFNHNLETVPRLYKQARPGADYIVSLELLRDVKAHMPGVPTKSGIMLGLGETTAEVIEVMKDMREYDIDMLTLGQYLQPSRHHLAVEKYYTPEEFIQLKEVAENLGFQNVASGAMVRSSYHADEQAEATIG